MSPRRAFVAAAVALTVLGGCGGDADNAAPTTTTAAGTDDTSSVVLKGNKFTPEEVSVKAGETVTWEWDDGAVAHDVNGGDAFKSEIQTEGTFEHTFAEAGTFEYKCTVHPTMTGTVEVSE